MGGVEERIPSNRFVKAIEGHNLYFLFRIYIGIRPVLV